MTLTLKQILESNASTWVNQKECDVAETTRLKRVYALGGSKTGDVAFFFSKDAQAEVSRAAPSVLFTADSFVAFLKTSPLWGTTAVLTVADPYLTMGRMTEALTRGWPQGPREKLSALEVDASAVVDPSARLPRAGKIGPKAVIGAGSVLEEQVRIGAGAVIGERCRVGEFTEIFPNAVLYPETEVGAFCRIHSGTVIGADGFGYAPIVEAKKPVGHQKIYHSGRVKIGNHVEIGACSSVDRGTFLDTVIEDHVKIDNQVQVGHNCHVKRGAILCGCVGVAGSSVIGEFAVLGGMAAVINKAVIGAGASVGSQALVGRDLEPGESVTGSPARPVRQYLRLQGWLNKNAFKSRSGGSDES